MYWYIVYELGIRKGIFFLKLPLIKSVSVHQVMELNSIQFLLKYIFVTYLENTA